MTQDQPDRLDRIEAALEAMQQHMNQMQQRMDQTEQRRDQIEQRRDEEFERQLQLNAEFRVRQQLEQQAIAELKEANIIALERERVQSQNIELLANMVQTMVAEFHQHRSDGHGA